MKKYFRIGIHHIQVDHEANNIVMAGSKGDDFELKVIHNNRPEVENLEDYALVEDGGHKEFITEARFMSELRTVLLMAESKAMYLHDPRTYEKLQKQGS